jgi:pimeloyl-ACP methyl ester carboxylesterase
VARDYRFVFIDQRGTGEFGALRCPQLQGEIGNSDIIAPSRAAVENCAGIVGVKAPFFGTDQTVADFDLLRQALGVQKMVVDGVSYGTVVASRYAIAHPDHVGKLVLDSVLPHHLAESDSLYLAGLKAQARVLREACTAPACGFDPADDLAFVVRQRSAEDGVRIFHTLVEYEFKDTTFRDPTAGNIIGALHAARLGDPTSLNTLITALAPTAGDPVTFSTGLHVATVCTDFRFPWGDASTPVASRLPALTASQNTLQDKDVWPYTPGVATGQGFVQDCVAWPAQTPAANPAGTLPSIPVLLLNGERDLSTPFEWAQQELATAPQGKLIVVPGAVHSVQNREAGRVGRDAVISFLAS